MAQSGYTPILIYGSSTAGNSPSASNLTNSTLGSELAINVNDGKLFYKDSSGSVQVIGWKTTPTSAGGTGLTSYTAGDLLYYASGTTLSKLGIGASSTILTSTGSAPQWSAASAVTVGTATNANNINIADDNSTNATYYPVWVTATGNKPPYISTSNLTWNPLFSTLTSLGGSVKAYAINAYGGTSGSTIGASSYIGSVNGNVQPTLEVRQQRGNQDNLVVTTNQNLYAYLFRVQENAADRFVIRGTGSGFGVGIGTATPGYQLELNADSAGKPSTNTWTITSDSRVKTVIREFTKGLETICGLRPVVYKYNGLAGFKDIESENISIIADEAKNFLPEDVGTYKAKLHPNDVEETELLNWKGHAVIFALINSVKELKNQLDELKQQLVNKP